jgi:hypothetical protein
LPPSSISFMESLLSSYLGSNWKDLIRFFKYIFYSLMSLLMFMINGFLFFPPHIISSLLLILSIVYDVLGDSSSKGMS